MDDPCDFGEADPALIAAWLTARSVARGLPLPVCDRGGLRVDINLTSETCRWVFPRMANGLIELGREISLPLHFLKLCDRGSALSGVLPPRWQLQAPSYVMLANVPVEDAVSIPPGYTMEFEDRSPTTHVRIVAADGCIAASGYAAEAADVFIYDRIVTSPTHQRRGLGRAVMIALGSMWKSASAPQILVATEDGRKLYAGLGWTIYAPYASASIPVPVG